MTLRQDLFRIARVAAFGAAVNACSHDDSSTVIKPDLPHFNDITTAPSKIQTAARAVVRLATAGQMGSGSFISPTGLLLTNNHVLGDSVCPIEGCYVEMSQMYQRGQPLQKPSTVMAKPIAVDVGLDMAVVQLVDPTTSSNITTPDYLSFDSLGPAALLDMHVTIVGHPEGNLKKWTDGVVVDTTGNWFMCTAYTLPGDSGSPVLNDAGQIVGLIHRGPTSLDLITDNGINVYSVGTASAPLVTAMNAASLPSTMISESAATTTAQFLANDFVYLNSRTSTVTVDGVSASALTVLGQACDTALARNNFASPDDLSAALAPCYDAQTWIECRTDAPAPAYGVVCPSSTDQATWSNRYQSMNNLGLAMNGIPDYGSVSFAIAALQSTMAAGTTAGAASLQLVLGNVAPTLDFELAYFLAAFAINTYSGTRISDYIVSYKNVPHYGLQATYIAYAASWLTGSSISEAELITLVKQLMADPTVDIGSQLSLEDFLYELNAL